MTNPNIYSTVVGLDLIPITPDDNNDLPVFARNIRVGTGGTLRFTALSGQVRNTNVVDGELFPNGARRVHATGTTAGGLEAVT